MLWLSLLGSLLDLIGFPGALFVFLQVVSIFSLYPRSLPAPRKPPQVSPRVRLRLFCDHLPTSNLLNITKSIKVWQKHSLQPLSSFSFSLARSLSLCRTSLARWMLSHWERSLGLQEASRSIVLSASRLHPASSSLCSNNPVRRLNSRHSEDWVIRSCIMQRASISHRISLRSCSSQVISIRQCIEWILILPASEYCSNPRI
jgi:hypothetical protein